MHEWELLAAGGFPAAGLGTTYQPGRPPWPPEVQRRIQALWARRRRAAHRAGRTFYNGRLFRVQAFTPAAAGLTLALADTDYREYVAARAGLLPAGQADPLGVAAALITADSRILIGRRRGVDTYTGRYDVIGGFVDREVDWQQTAGPATPDPAGAMVREVWEETGVGLARTVLICLGLVYDRSVPHPTLCFAARLPLAFADLAALPVQEQETAGWEPLPDDPAALSAFLTEHHGALSPTAEATLALWGEQAYGRAWWDALVASLGGRAAEPKPES
ncbi:MAG: NUDIX domain-containing protein [Chloroflexi bacterium]|nr:NUDIX domain-containing protein [Chloroflexota bacterium]